MPDIEQVLNKKKPFILRCMRNDLDAIQGRRPEWNRSVLNAWIT